MVHLYVKLLGTSHNQSLSYTIFPVKLVHNLTFSPFSLPAQFTTFLALFYITGKDITTMVYGVIGKYLSKFQVHVPLDPDPLLYPHTCLSIFIIANT